jgi:hypothetical protein
VSVTGDTATVTVTFAANTSTTTATTYTVSIAPASTLVKGGATVAIIQAASAADQRAALTAGQAVPVEAAAVTASVTFTGATGLGSSLTNADFTADNGASVTGVSVSGDTATVTVGFAANTSITTGKTFTVSIAAGSTKIKGGATVAINQAKAASGPTDLTAGLYKGTDTAAIDVSGAEGGGLLEKSINWLRTHAATGTTYSVLLGTGETLNPTELSQAELNSADNLVVILKGLGTERTIQAGANGSLFTVDQGITLILDGFLTLKGRNGNTTSLVRIKSGGALEMRGTSKITGNISSGGRGGGVSVIGGGSFTMSDNATVSGNTASYIPPTPAYGGGVYVSGGSFTMSGSAMVSGNTASSSFDASLFTASASGGGVSVLDGSFTMSGNAMVSGNRASSSNPSGTSKSSGGGVYISSSGGSFTMSDSATVSGNTASSSYSYGGGVYVSGTGATFTMSDGAAVSGNTASSSSDSLVLYGTFGGGVYVSGGSFTMSGGTISGNTVTYSTTAGGAGGGVSVSSSSSFTKTGGVIYGNNETVATLRNVVKTRTGVVQTDKGAAVYVDSTHRRETTVAAAQDISKDGTTYTGQWTD